MRFAYAVAFHRAIRALDPVRAGRLLKAVGNFERSWPERRFAAGLGLKHLRDDFYVFRAGLHDRVLFRRRGEDILYLLYGSHDALRRFLKTL